MPLLYLPSKETCEELLSTRFTTAKQNFVCTFVLVFISYTCAMFIPSIGDAMALAGCTTNPMIGFIIPCMLQWRVH